ncbi:AAA family ATPase [Corynebacterium cystitidis]|uniref:AAA family ATPase n=1 Tax=Corynebacterium cystitidis TaxID=35757 RepID=UPI00211DFA3C|nr:ATP-binding protein [Corynebacterium cystitidis]
MVSPVITELRLTSFKSFHNEVLPLDPVAFLIGRNSSGKSNALDALDVLARLAEGDELTDSLDGRSNQRKPVRGRSSGCAPHGETSFALGCTVVVGDDHFNFDVEIAVDDYLRVISEELTGPGTAVKSGKREIGATLYKTNPASGQKVGIDVQIYNGKEGRNPSEMMRDSKLVLTQIPLHVPGKNRAERSVLDAVNLVRMSLRSVFHLDPVPHLMREFVPEYDVDLRRSGENVSAALKEMREEDREAFNKIESLVKEVADETVVGIDFVESDLQDVMIALQEALRVEEGSVDSSAQRTPAREMSDGLLRLIAIATALQLPPSQLSIEGASDREQKHQPVAHVVIEEIDNGLHPSQTGLLLDLVRDSHETLGTRMLLTTHSPALLDAIDGELNRSVVVVYRDPETGWSRVKSLVDLDNYVRAVAQGSLGDAATAGTLIDESLANQDYSALDELLGI